MTVVYPDSTPVLGNSKVTAVTAIASLAAPKLATEINAASSVDATCYFTAAGWAPTASTNKGTRNPRLCSRVQVDTLNRTTFTLGDLMYIYDPQGAAGATGNKLKTLLAEGTKIYFVERLGLDGRNTINAVAQLVRTHYVLLGPQIVSGDRTDENGEFYITQSASYVNDGPVDGIIAT